LRFKHFGVIHVMTAQSVAPRSTIMTTFTIDAENNITAFPTPDHAETAVGAGAQPFTSQQQLGELAATWPAERLLAIWNSFAGVAGFGADLKPVQKFTDRKTAIKRIWTAIQKLAAVPQTSEAAAETAAPKASTAKPAAEPEKPKAERKATGGAQAAKGASAKAKATKKATPAKNAPKATKAAKAPETAGPREGSKTATVVAMLQRKSGATLPEIMQAMGWQKHTVRGFMAGAMKKAGYTVESLKPEGGERTYRINS
jgi:hypothetical protein